MELNSLDPAPTKEALQNIFENAHLILLAAVVGHLDGRKDLTGSDIEAIVRSALHIVIDRGKAGDYDSLKNRVVALENRLFADSRPVEEVSRARRLG